ncbi:nuclear transport factor 2 family protein [Sphingobium lactosutens]|uniref:nuclear transport factor 2 family protein n=1 Tax=Sphingobium lactosutens TaxID=522773 RepID=UPI0015BC3495|nr:nuclear transport factor 2 family protein [Sphingobium lactosutens]NWK94439.1 nuclear transport factor 2 family protein [Sphingobium lactosutens]
MINEDEFEQLKKDVRVLKDIEAIRELKYRYLNCVDTGDMAGLRALLHDDLTTDFAGGHFEVELRGADRFIEFIGKTLHSRFIAIHLGHHPRIDIIGEHEALGSWYLWDDDMDLTTATRIFGTALYEDRYVRVDGRWLIRHTGYRRVFHAHERLGPMDVTVHMLSQTGYRHSPESIPVPLGLPPGKIEPA